MSERVYDQSLRGVDRLIAWPAGLGVAWRSMAWAGTSVSVSDMSYQRTTNISPSLSHLDSKYVVQGDGKLSSDVTQRRYIICPICSYRRFADSRIKKYMFFQ